MGGRIPLQEALEQLLLAYAPPIACEKLNEALRRNDVRLYCNGNLLTASYVTTDLRVVVEQEADGRWQCAVVPIRTAWEPKPYTWEVEDIDTLMPPQLSGMQDRSRDSWKTKLSLEILALQRKGSPLLKNFKQLAEHLAIVVRAKTGGYLPDTKRFHKQIRAFLRGQFSD
jgi:hypothetical protein